MTAIQDKGKNIEELTHLQGTLRILQILLSETNTLQTRLMNKTYFVYSMIKKNCFSVIAGYPVKIFFKKVI